MVRGTDEVPAVSRRISWPLGDSIGHALNAVTGLEALSSETAVDVRQVDMRHMVGGQPIYEAGIGERNQTVIGAGIVQDYAGNLGLDEVSRSHSDRSIGERRHVGGGTEAAVNG